VSGTWVRIPFSLFFLNLLYFLRPPIVRRLRRFRRYIFILLLLLNKYMHIITLTWWQHFAHLSSRWTVLCVSGLASPPGLWIWLLRSHEPRLVRWSSQVPAHLLVNYISRPHRKFRSRSGFSTTTLRRLPASSWSAGQTPLLATSDVLLQMYCLCKYWRHAHLRRRAL